jgi:CheY-like chemotaxis protein
MATILVADDAHMIRELLHEVLTSAGHDVLLAEDGLQIIAACEDNEVDLVITDIFMPAVGGLHAIDTVLKADPDQKIIAMSGGGDLSQQESLDFATSFGASRTLTKPLDTGELLRTVDELLKN